MRYKVYWLTWMVLFIQRSDKKYIVCIWYKVRIEFQEPLIKLPRRTYWDIKELQISELSHLMLFSLYLVDLQPKHILLHFPGYLFFSIHIIFFFRNTLVLSLSFYINPIQDWSGGCGGEPKRSPIKFYSVTSSNTVISLPKLSES